MLKHRVIAVSLMGTLTLFSVGCSKPEPVDPAARAASTGYMSENQQYVEQLNNEVELGDADKLLDEINQPATPTR